MFNIFNAVEHEKFSIIGNFMHVKINYQYEYRQFISFLCLIFLIDTIDNYVKTIRDHICH